jgi:hypothetical protein
VNPWLVLDWAEACEREAAELDAQREGLLAAQHRAWAAELRASYARFMSSPNSVSAATGGISNSATPTESHENKK